MHVRVFIFYGVRVIVQILGVAVSIVEIQTTKRENRWHLNPIPKFFKLIVICFSNIWHPSASEAVNKSILYFDRNWKRIEYSRFHAK